MLNIKKKNPPADEHYKRVKLTQRYIMKGYGHTSAVTAAAGGSLGMRAGRVFPVITVYERLGPFPEDVRFLSSLLLSAWLWLSNSFYFCRKSRHCILQGVAFKWAIDVFPWLWNVPLYCSRVSSGDLGSTLNCDLFCSFCFISALKPIIWLFLIPWNTLI